MSDLPENIAQWNEWKAWESIMLQTNAALPEIALLSLNRPDKLNAINDTMMDDFRECLDLLDQSYDCRVLVLGGSGRLFCSGADLTVSPLAEQKYDWAKFPDKVKVFWQLQTALSSLFPRLRKIPQPIIAAVHGAAVGGGMAMANASDIVIAARSARFINAFCKIGLSGADCASSYFLPRLIGFHRSAELLYTGRDLSAEEAYQWGYVNQLVNADDEVIPQAVHFAAEHLLSKSPLGLRMTKEALNANMDASSIESAVKLEDRNQTICVQSDDAIEGVMSFFEKRKPKYGPR